MHINQIATQPDSYGPRFVRTIKPDDERCCGKIPPGQPNPEIISTPRLARIIPAGMNRACNDARGHNEGYYDGAHRVLVRALCGEELSSFYADYQIHPDDADKGCTLAATMSHL